MRLNAKINISFNSNPSLEPKHTLFYYQVDYLSLQRMCSGLHQVTKTDKMSIKKDVRIQYHTIVRMYILWSNDRFRLNDSLLVTFTRTMPSILSPFLMFLRPFYKIKLYICL